MPPGTAIPKRQQINKSIYMIHSERRVVKMKNTGIVRKVDELGRIVLPVELRRTLGIDVKDALEIYVDDEQIILRKYEPACIFCGEAKGVTNFKGKNVCTACLAEMGAGHETV